MRVSRKQCPGGKLSQRRSVLTAKCPNGEIPNGELSHGKCSTAKCRTAYYLKKLISFLKMMFWTKYKLVRAEAVETNLPSTKS